MEHQQPGEPGPVDELGHVDELGALADKLPHGAYIGLAASAIPSHLTDYPARRAELGHWINVAATFLGILARHYLDGAHAAAMDKIEQAYQTGHRRGWHERGEQLDHAGT